MQMHPGLGDSLESVIHFLFDAKALEVYTSSSDSTTVATFKKFIRDKRPYKQFYN
jgi:hypothetical protein